MATLADNNWIEHGPLSIRIERVPEELWLIELYGELVLEGVDFVSNELLLAEASDVRRIIVDLSAVNFVDSAGLAVLYGAQTRSNQDSNRLRFLRGGGQVERVIKMTGLDSVLQFAD